MRLKRVPISYGLPRNDEELWDARAKLFPNAKAMYWVDAALI